MAHNDARAAGARRAGAAAIAAYEARAARRRRHARGRRRSRADVERFDGSVLQLERRLELHRRPARAGRSASVRRRAGSDFADQSGEVPVTLKLPAGRRAAGATRPAAIEWRWTAHFEAFASRFDLAAAARATPAGRATASWSAASAARAGRRVPYQLDLAQFRVEPWSGITVEDLRVDARRPRELPRRPAPRATRPAASLTRRDRPDRLPRTTLRVAARRASSSASATACATRPRPTDPAALRVVLRRLLVPALARLRATPSARPSRSSAADGPAAGSEARLEGGRWMAAEPLAHG